MDGKIKVKPLLKGGGNFTWSCGTKENKSLRGNVNCQVVTCLIIKKR